MLYFLKSSQKHEHKATVQEKGVSAVLTLTIQFQPFLWNILSSQKNQPRAKKTKCTQWWQFHVIPQIQQSHYCHIQILSVTIFSVHSPHFPRFGKLFPLFPPISNNTISYHLRAFQVPASLLQRLWQSQKVIQSKELNPHNMAPESVYLASILNILVEAKKPTGKQVLQFNHRIYQISLLPLETSLELQIKY